MRLLIWIQVTIIVLAMCAVCEATPNDGGLQRPQLLIQTTRISLCINAEDWEPSGGGGHVSLEISRPMYEEAASGDLELAVGVLVRIAVQQLVHWLVDGGTIR